MNFDSSLSRVSAVDIPTDVNNSIALQNEGQSTLEFLRIILPDDGHKFLALGKTGREGLKHKAFESLELMAQAIESYDAQNNLIVYHACCSYKAASYEAEVNGETKVKYRGAQNWDKAKSFWIDIDCGEDKAAEGKGYLNKTEAAKAILGFCKTHQFPNPMLVDSGGGLHCYWPLTKAIGPNSWRTIANEFKAALNAAGLLVDPTRTADLSSILRPVGSHNRKPGREVREVKVKTQPTFVEPQDFAASVSRAVTTLRAHVPSYSSAPSLNDDLITPYDGPQYETSARLIADHCQQVRFMRDTKGDVNYEHWRGVIGLIKHCTEDIDLAHEWSERRADTGHSNIDVVTRYESWNSGPTTCSFFDKSSIGGCNGCQHQGSITSPIQLGRSKAISNEALKLENRLVAWDPNAPMPLKREFLIADGGLFPFKTVSTLAGLGGSMKTAKVIMLGLHSAYGKSWNGWKVSEGQTLILSSEDDASEFQRRVGGYANANFSGEDFSVIQRRVHCLPLVGLGIRLTQLRSGTPQMSDFVPGVVQLIAHLNSNGQPPVRLVVVDHARLLIGGDLNSSEHATAGMEACTRIALETGAAVVLIAHSPKAAASPDRSTEGFGVADVLGSGAFVDNSRFSAVMTKLTSDERKKYGLTAESAKDYLAQRIIKSNYSEAGRVIYLKKITVPGWGVAFPAPVELSAPQKNTASSLIDLVIAAVAANPGRYTRSKLRGESGVDGPFKASDKKVRIAVDEAIALGRLIERQAVSQDVSSYGVRLRDRVLILGATYAS